MPQVTIFRKNGEYNTLTQRQVVNNVDTLDGRELYFRGEVSDGVFNILMNGTIEEHDEQARKILKG